MAYCDQETISDRVLSYLQCVNTLKMRGCYQMSNEKVSEYLADVNELELVTGATRYGIQAENNYIDDDVDSDSAANISCWWCLGWKRSNS